MLYNVVVGAAASEAFFLRLHMHKFSGDTHRQMSYLSPHLELTKNLYLPFPLL